MLNLQELSDSSTRWNVWVENELNQIMNQKQLPKMSEKPSCFCNLPAHRTYDTRHDPLLECGQYHVDERDVKTKFVCGFHLHERSWKTARERMLVSQQIAEDAELESCSLYNLTFCILLKTTNSRQAARPHHINESKDYAMGTYNSAVVEREYQKEEKTAEQAINKSQDHKESLLSALLHPVHNLKQSSSYMMPPPETHDSNSTTSKHREHKINSFGSSYSFSQCIKKIPLTHEDKALLTKPIKKSLQSSPSNLISKNYQALQSLLLQMKITLKEGQRLIGGYDCQREKDDSYMRIIGDELTRREIKIADLTAERDKLRHAFSSNTNLSPLCKVKYK
ncbi:hypothetical protein G6F57_000605 [Rhizopus arrhizus]|nr:hypothetical protein G6F22_006315 [Rhizopus arrhizus]KAG1429214.1 hypothetical protein G6F58_000147 [Rhizopus delemar]KAG0797416.1 hypothetical protein G6F21_000552 [Rhizopus arrhizus]KAG0819335.1 hypothetical protein G6F20_000853 [Rhizopus arrhizus]KAG0842603.1 hypothetical protein G6F19_000965 [Rhizopus arrhizus]